MLHPQQKLPARGAANNFFIVPRHTAVNWKLQWNTFGRPFSDKFL